MPITLYACGIVRLDRMNYVRWIQELDSYFAESPVRGVGVANFVASSGTHHVHEALNGRTIDKVVASVELR